MDLDWFYHDFQRRHLHVMFISRGWNPLSGNGPHPSPRFFLNVGSVLRQLEAFAIIKFHRQGPGEKSSHLPRNLSPGPDITLKRVLTPYYFPAMQQPRPYAWKCICAKHLQCLIMLLYILGYIQCQPTIRNEFLHNLPFATLIISGVP